jgi:serine/threonine-protein kinase
VEVSVPEVVEPEPVAAMPPVETPVPVEEPQPELAAAAVPPPSPPPVSPATAPAQPATTPAPQAAVAQPAGKSRAPLIVLGALVLVLVAVAGLWFGGYADKLRGLVKLPGSGEVSPQVGPQVAESGGSSDPVAIKAALNEGLPSIGCTWLDVSDMSQNGSNMVVALHGVASNPADAQAQITKMLAAKNLNVGTIDFKDVAPIESSECGPLDALRQIRDPAGGRISVPQRQIEMTKLTSGEYAGSLGAKAAIEFNLSDPSQEMALFGIEPSGKISQLTSDRSQLVEASENLGGDRYRLTIDVNHTGWSGMLLLTGQKPFDNSKLAGPAGSRTGDWSNQFLTEAKSRGWKAEMVWFETVDDQPN